MTRRRWIADQWTGSTASITGEQAAHLARVLRAAPGQEFDVVAGGHLHLARIVSVTPEEVRMELLEEQKSEPALPVTLLLAVSKFDRMEWALEKVTEIGVLRILPVLAHRTEKHLAQAASKRVERWRKIVLEASKQSRRSDVPAVEAPLPLDAALSIVPPNASRILLSETEHDAALLSVPEASMPDVPLWLAIGTEGGWDAREQKMFAEAGWKPVTLGPRILRVETAAIFALAAIAASRLAAQSNPAQATMV